MQVDRIENSLLNSNTYIISVEEGDFLIDCGDIYKLKDNFDIKAVFITHPHFDHIYGLNELMKRFPDCKVYIYEEGYEALYNERLNLSKYYGISFEFISKNIVLLNKKNSVIDFDGLKVEVIHTPGHYPGAVCYRIHNYLFSGDSYIPGFKTVINLPQSNKKDAIASEILIKRLWTENVVLCPGHGNNCSTGK